MSPEITLLHVYVGLGHHMGIDGTRNGLIVVVHVVESTYRSEIKLPM